MPRSEPELSLATPPTRVARIAVEGAPFHLGDTLDYSVPPDVAVGERVMLTLAGRATSGLVTEIAAESDIEPRRLRPIRRKLGDFAWVDDEGIALLRWAASRFAAPLGDVVRHALPRRVVDEERRAAAQGWWPPTPQPDRSSSLGSQSAPPAHRDQWLPYGPTAQGLLDATGAGHGSFLLSPLPGHSLSALITDLAQRTLTGGRDVLVVVPGPVSDVADQVLELVPESHRIDLRGGLSPRQNYRAWLRARAGYARVVVGERAACFAPVTTLGLAVLVDEADPTHKERRSPRHHAREILLERARRSRGVGLCTGDVPSAVAQKLLQEGRLRRIAPERSEVVARRPRILLETGEREARARISRAGLRLLRDAVAKGGYGLVLAARRGEGRSLVCTRCRGLVRCSRCQASVARSPDGGWWCAACGNSSVRAPRCERCGPTELSPLAAGASRLGQELARSLDASVVVLEGHAQEIPVPPAVVVMTRGSVLDRPPPHGTVHGVLLPDMDGALRRPALDASEDALRLAFRVAGWTVAKNPSSRNEPSCPDVVVETRDPQHHALQALVQWDPEGFWTHESALRAGLQLPPHRWAIRIETVHDTRLVRELQQNVAPDDLVVGPLPMREGRVALLILCQDRNLTLQSLHRLRTERNRAGREIRVDVDPIDLG